MISSYECDRLLALSAVWRVGGKVPLNVYENDKPMFQCHTPEDAARVVEALNALPALVRDLKAAMDLLNRAGGAVKLLGQIFGGYAHPSGSTVTLSGVSELLAEIEAVLDSYHAKPADAKATEG